MTRPIPPALLAAARKNRREQTPAEEKLWDRLRDRRLDGIRFKRQTVIGTYIADFYCPRCKLIIELDGSIHDVTDVKMNDHDRQKNLESLGYTLIRFTNTQIEHNLPDVLSAILKATRGE